MDLSDVSTVHYPINLAYLSEFFNRVEQFNLTAHTLLNHTVGTDLPDLAVVDKLLDEKFAEEEAAAFDMEMVIKSTKTSTKVYDNLAHYLFNEMITAQDNAGDFDFFSPWTWFMILGWIVAIAALVLVIMLCLKVRPLFFLLMAKGSQAASLKLALPKYMLEPPQVTPPPLDILAEWINHMSHVPNLLPAEILILLGIIFAILFKDSVHDL